MADKNEYSIKDVLNDVTKLVLAMSKVAEEIKIFELRHANESIAKESLAYIR